MITLTQAVTLVEQEINASTIYEDEAKKVVLSDSTVEKKWGWVIFYQSAAFLESKNQSDMLAGNTPYIVNKETGELFVTGTAWPLDKYIEDYETQILGRT